MKMDYNHTFFDLKRIILPPNGNFQHQNWENCTLNEFTRVFWQSNFI